MADVAEKEEFEKIFDEAVEADGAGASSTGTNADEKQAESTQAEEKAQGEEDASQAKADGTDNSGSDDRADDNDAGGEQTTDQSKVDQGDQQVPYEKLLQQKKSLEGMFNSNLRKVKELEEKIAQISASQAAGGDTSKSGAEGAQAEPEQKKPVTHQQETLTAYEQNERIQAFIDDFPDIHQGVQEIIKYEREAIKKSFEAFARIIAPVLQDRFTSTIKQRETEIAGKHADFPELKNNGALNQWISELPSFKQKAYTEVLESGDPADVVEVLNEFKQAHGTITPEGNGDTVISEAALERARKLRNSEGIRSKTGPVSGKTSVAAKDDFVGAFEEAVKIG